MARTLTRTAAGAVTGAVLLALVAIAPANAGTVTRDRGAETYALRLLDCTRTGGFVKADGTCVGRGSGTYSAQRQPLRRHRAISTRVAWPWARAMVVHDVCAHAIPGRPVLAQRMRRNGFRAWAYGENVGCGWGSGDAASVVLATHRAMQAEKRVGGGHWRNIKNPAYRSVGIGVATGNGRVMVVWDFYGQRY